VTISFPLSYYSQASAPSQVFKGDKALSVSTVSFVVFNCFLSEISHTSLSLKQLVLFSINTCSIVFFLSFSFSIQRRLASLFVYSCLATNRPLLRFVFIDMYLDFILAGVRSQRAGTIHSFRRFIETMEVVNHKANKEAVKMKCIRPAQRPSTTTELSI
jgi:hypothetical protein